jgi:hypothetical protein
MDSRPVSRFREIWVFAWMAWSIFWLVFDLKMMIWHLAAMQVACLAVWCILWCWDWREGYNRYEPPGYGFVRWWLRMR